MEKRDQNLKKFGEKSDFIIIGSGLAGLYAALLLSRYGNVLVLSKKSVVESNTWYAQGGIAAALSDPDSPAQHFADTMTAGAGFNDPEAVNILVEEGPKGIKELQELGVAFDRQGKDLALGQEGAHSFRRVLRIGGDATGRHLVDSLYRLAQQKENIFFDENAFVVDLIVDKGECKGICWYHNGEIFYLYSKAVILATGGGGFLFSRTTNPETATADGVALAYHAGAAVANLEFVQFHPTVFFKESKAFLISEAVRGEGGYLVNETGERFMFNYHQDGELGPRDIVARAIVWEMNNTGGSVYLDLRHLPGDFIKKRFPTIYAKCLEWGVDITMELLPVCPASHYFIGGVKVDHDSKTTVERLFAVGETASSGVHGANRLASNSLLEALVFSRRAAYYIAENLASKDLPAPVKVETVIPQSRESENALQAKIELRRLMWEKVGLFRQEDVLLEAIQQIEEWMEKFDYETKIPEIKELQNMLLVSRLIAEASLRRRESRGCHFRLDYPEISPEAMYYLIFQKKDGFKGVQLHCSFPHG